MLNPPRMGCQMPSSLYWFSSAAAQLQVGGESTRNSCSYLPNRLAIPPVVTKIISFRAKIEGYS